MKNLKTKLREYLQFYEIGSRRFTAERILEDPGIDYPMNETALFREHLERHKDLLNPEELLLLEEADRRFLETWEKIKDIEPKTPYNKIAKAFLEDIVKIAKRSLSTKTT